MKDTGFIENPVEQIKTEMALSLLLGASMAKKSTDNDLSLLKMAEMVEDSPIAQTLVTSYDYFKAKEPDKTESNSNNSTEQKLEQLYELRERYIQESETQESMKKTKSINKNYPPKY